MLFGTDPIAAEAVHLAADGGRAYVPTGWQDMGVPGDPCEKVVWFRVTPPAGGGSLLLRVGDPSGAGYVGICEGGAVTVLPFTAKPY